MREGEQWVIMGPNGSGKSIFAKAIAGLLPVRQGEIILHFIKNHPYPFPAVHRNLISYISFETQQKFFAKDNLQRDLESYVGLHSSGTLVGEYLSDIVQGNGLGALFAAVKPLVDRELVTLSTGEMRKVFLYKAFAKNPKLVILDEPFDGLDKESKAELFHLISALLREASLQIILIVHRPDEIPDEITNILEVRDCMIFAQGPKEIMVKQFTDRSKLKKELSESVHKKNESGKVILEMKDVTVKYGNALIIDQVNWKVREGENWVIIGPNGAGKSTLIHLITGDNQQSYANAIKIFGKERGIEISQKEIKEQIGIVSTDLMLKYQKEMNAFDVILSGFFDSIGLYRKATKNQRSIASEWIAKLDLEDIVGKEFEKLSFGQKRLVLIARALVKYPRLLILDEPCHGLDWENRKKVLQVVNTIGKSLNIILITHQQDEIVPIMTNKMTFERGKIVEVKKLS